ncbi:MAG: phosphoribosylanthranilate isomerase [Terrimicrobiaceae bacterium]
MNFLDPGNPVRIKICGITSLMDAEMAVAEGADALGFNFYPGSKRRIVFEENRQWIGSLSGRVFRVAVVVNPEMDELRALRESGCFEAVQFHGDETPEFCAHAGFPAWIRAVRVKSEESLREALRYGTRHLLLDAWSESAYGGTGLRLDWEALREFVDAQPARQVILAGGLAPENVGEAIRIVHPHAVDTASGVENGPGRKARDRVAEFIRAARAA